MFSVKEVNLETITHTQSSYKVWPLNGHNLIRANRKLLRKQRRVYGSFSSRQKSQKSYTLTNQLHFLITYTWDALTANANGTKVSLTKTEKCSNHEFPPEQLKSYLAERNLTRTRSLGLMTWEDTRRNVWNDILRTGKQKG